MNPNAPVTTISIPPPPNGFVDVGMIAAIRCILAFSALLVAYVDPTQPAIFSTLTYGSLVIYALWSCFLVINTFRRDPTAPPRRDTHWADLFFCAYLVTLTQGTNSLFFTFFLFAILSASFSRGTQEGLLLTFSSVILFVLASLWFEPEAKFGFDQSLVRPIYLLTLGYMISYWGGLEITQMRRIQILQSVNEQFNQRLGSIHAIKINLCKIVHFYDATACILVLNRTTPSLAHQSFYISNQNKSNSSTPKSANCSLLNSLDEKTEALLLDLPDSFAINYRPSTKWWKKILPSSLLNKTDPVVCSKLELLSNLLDTETYLTLPYIQNDHILGRLFIIPKQSHLTKSDFNFTKQLLASIARVVENTQLVEELVASSAKHERFTISLDIHDTTVQPYIGLKLGLDALSRKAEKDNPLKSGINELLTMTEATITDLRRYVTTLREGQTLTKDSLIHLLNEQADHFKRFYGINVQVNCDSDIQLESRFAYAVLQIFSEGLSNVLKHTQAKQAYISMHYKNNYLLLEIGNEASDAKTTDFIPRSINARSLSLGGTCFAKFDARGYTVVYISIPLF
jgi:signal transduction histidine kinase